MQLENKNEMDREKWVNKMEVMHKFATETGTRNWKPGIVPCPQGKRGSIKINKN